MLGLICFFRKSFNLWGLKGIGKVEGRGGEELMLKGKEGIEGLGGFYGIGLLGI